MHLFIFLYMFLHAAMGYVAEDSVALSRKLEVAYHGFNTGYMVSDYDATANTQKITYVENQKFIYLELLKYMEMPANEVPVRYRRLINFCNLESLREIFQPRLAFGFQSASVDIVRFIFGIKDDKISTVDMDVTKYMLSDEASENLSKWAAKMGISSVSPTRSHEIYKIWSQNDVAPRIRKAKLGGAFNFCVQQELLGEDFLKHFLRFKYVPSNVYAELKDAFYSTVQKD